MSNKEPKKDWHSLSVAEAFRELGSSNSGLGLAEAVQRLQAVGRNELPQTEATTALSVFLRQFKSTLIIVLIVAALLSAGVGEVIDAGVILAAVFVNVAVGYIQERKAEAALQELRKFVQYSTRVVRGGAEHVSKVEELVPGDIVRVTAGDRVPADCLLLQASELEVNEAMLTGESLPVEKSVGKLEVDTVLAERSNMVYLGTAVVRGTGLALVVATGPLTELGMLASLIQGMEDEPTPLKVKLERFGRVIGIVVVAACLVLLGVGMVLGQPFKDMFVLAVAVAVSAVPEGLVVVLTAILAFGMRRILARHALVRKLMAAETLGSTTVICTDKTGTITTGEMAVGQIITPSEIENHSSAEPASGEEARKLLVVGVLCSHAYLEQSSDPGVAQDLVVGNATERALLIAAQQSGLPILEERARAPMVSEVPFSSERKYMLTVHTQAGGTAVAYLKGAPELVLDASTMVRGQSGGSALETKARAKFLAQVDQLSAQGYRLLALAERELAVGVVPEASGVELSGFTFLGFVALRDPIRPEVRDTLAATKRAGMRVIMITGDHRLTAQVIAQEVGLPATAETIIEGKELANLNESELAERLRTISVVARAVPQDKLRIISALQARGEVVAMTGDGVNDAPALKAADIGVALGSGSDVAKEASDLVLLDNNFTTIVAAVEEGRVIVSNIRKVVLYLVADSFAELILILGAFVWSEFQGGGLVLPLLATQILWVNFVSDTFPAIALASDPLNPGVMEQPPVGRSMPILGGARRGLAVTLSLSKGLAGLLVFIFILQAGAEVGHARTLVFTFMVLSSFLYLFSMKQSHHSIFHRLTWNNRNLFIAAGIGTLLHLVVIYTPLGQSLFHTVPLDVLDWVLVLTMGFGLVVLIELFKYVVWIAPRRLRAPLLTPRAGFTLIELLVVISIIALLSTLAVVAVSSARAKAKTTAYQATVKQILTAIDLKRDEQNKVLLDVTGSGCSACACVPQQKPPTSACVTSMTTAFTRLGFPGILNDPWGDPILIDENEHEGGSSVCTWRDTISSFTGGSTYVPFWFCP